MNTQTIIAVDPGPMESAFVIYRAGTIQEFGKILNEALRGKLAWRDKIADLLVIEMVACYGMPVGAEVFETCVWIGRFIELFGESERILRATIKTNLCGTPNAKDPNVRQAVIDRFGGSAAIGNKKTPGPLYGVSGDVWSALAVALTWDDQQKLRRRNA